MSAPSKVDRLIEMGLSRYGAGDFEGALLMWEEALAIEPNNKQASSYVDYVRLHVELLAGDPEVVPADEAPFAIEEEPEYQIEVAAGELPARTRTSEPVFAPDELDGGWFAEEVSTHDAKSRAETVPYENGEPPALELEADLPPLPEISFEPATREYYGTPTAPVVNAELSDFADVGTQGGTREFVGRRDASGLLVLDAPAGTDPSPEVPRGFGSSLPGTGNASDFAQEEYTGGFHAESTSGFSSQETGIRKRDLGFVQPLSAPTPVKEQPSSTLSIGTAPTMDSIALGDLAPTTERASFSDSTSAAQDPDEDDLLATLPNPRRPNVQLELPPETQDIPVTPSAKAVTKEMPDAARPPATRDSSEHSQADVVLSHAATQDFQSRIDITAPTRDLGIRPLAHSKADIDDEAVTKQSDVRAIREAAARKEGAAMPVQPDPEGTRSDVALPFDPIDARAAEILEEVDASAPPDEPRDDQTRRRIAALLERAVQWNAIGETEKAVSAVDLAMSEDPNSALGQKLITRNRDTIMNVFQGYLGSLDRMPELSRPLHELQDAPISPRAAFLLSRIDGTLTLDELLDVSGMPRLEAFRHLCQLYLRNILR